jgi:hypothetical protein
MHNCPTSFVAAPSSLFTIATLILLFGNAIVILFYFHCKYNIYF